MGQKVNPRGFRIGVNDLWNTESQCYGKGFKNQKQIYKKVLPATNFLNKHFESKTFIKGNTLSKINDNRWEYNVQYVPLLAKSDCLVPTFKMFDLDVKKYNATFWHQNGALLCGFIKSGLKKGLAFRKIINTIKILFFNKKKHKIVLKTARGIQFYEFTGIKIRYAGRFGGSRSRMSSSIVFRLGAVSLQKLETYIEFFETPLYTKQGICNLQVWMAYKTI
uniref:Ribosomal protein S3 n=1 Tax=Pyropia yezoensis TaxID=2788 RepID=I0B724_PYRYE|nr:ribosomal protein S3 [Neopyropia yezoensis]AFH57692.1 ribosomal protein S3 [Neopyropia yezoensis]QGA30567.1 ribosomal protein S3 [Neopyropia yezoensis]